MNSGSFAHELPAGGRKKVQHGSALHLKLFSQMRQPLVDLMTDLVFDRFEPFHQLSQIFGGQELAGQRE